MLPLPTAIDTTSDRFQSNREQMLGLVEDLNGWLAQTRDGGGPRYVDRHRARGKMLVRERIELLLDEDAPFLELCPLAAWGSEFAVGGSFVLGVGVVSGVECAILAYDPTIRGGTGNPYTLKKLLRGTEVARRNRLPLIFLVESGGADLPTQSQVFVPGGALFRDLTQLSAMGIPTIALVFGNSTAGGAYIPGMSDYTVMVKGNAKVFLGGPPLVKMATGEDADDEALGGAEMHATRSGLADFLADDERDCIRIGRQIVSDMNWRKRTPEPVRPFTEPRFDPEELLGIVSPDLRQPFDIREVIARIVDGSEFDEFKPLYGTCLVTGWASIHGMQVGILGNNAVLFAEEAQKGTHFIELCNQHGVPILFLQNTTGFIVGERYEQAGIIKDGAKMINAVANSQVPHLTLFVGASYGAGNYAMCGRAYEPRFLFAWPNSKTAVMGPHQLAGVLSIVRRQAADAAGRPFDEQHDAQMRAEVEAQIETESLALFNSGQLYDDGVIDPRDTRTVLAIALSACRSDDLISDGRFAVFRM